MTSVKTRPDSASTVARSRSPNRKVQCRDSCTRTSAIDVGCATGSALGEICPICLDPCTTGNEAAWLYTCSHRVHKDCADDLIHSKNGRRCPLCRAPSRGVDAHGCPLLPLEESEEEEAAEEDEEADDEDNDFCDMMLGVVMGAFHKAYGPSRTNRRRNVSVVRELRWFVVLEFLNKKRWKLNELHERDWFSSKVTPGLFMTYLDMLVDSVEGVERDEQRNCMLFPDGNVLILPEQEAEDPTPTPSESTSTRSKIEMLLRAARGD